MNSHHKKSPLHNLIQHVAPTSLEGRRGFIRGMALGAAALTGLGLSGCGGGDGNSFDHGVASGDPLVDRVILWTRVTTADTAQAVTWQVASDDDFTQIVASGSATANAATDHTVKVDVTGLQPATAYWYRFKAGDTLSPVGRTKTLPGAGSSVSQVRLAVFSCASYPTGYFNVYAAAALRNDLDATVHLGDYLYEYERNGYASSNAAALKREVQPASEILSLADYRTRHAQYRTDPDLQALHARAPMIAVWDDHEVANDTYRTGAENHQPATEGDFAVRKAAAIQAYHEWMPTRVSSGETIYRSFDFGSLVSLHMLDTRVIGRDQQLDYANFITNAGIDAAGFTAAVSNPARQLLGATQTQWLQQQMTVSTATWQVLGQQVLMGRMNIPAPILLEANNPGTGVTVSQYAAIVGKFQTDPGTLTPTEQAILAQPSIPYNLDAWDGYAVARETVLGTALALNKNLVVLSGDTHNAWANDLQDFQGNTVGVEFATPSVSSPGFEEYLPKEKPAELAASLTQLIGPLQYCDTAKRGYMLLTATAAECRADWIFVSTIGSHIYTAATEKSLRVLPGSQNRVITDVAV